MSFDITQHWTWLLFESGLSPQRTKELLLKWQEQGVSLEEVLHSLPTKAKAWGLAPAERARLQACPAELPQVEALRWDETLYPAGLRDLPLKLRPALLFYAGEVSLLLKPIVYLTAIAPSSQAEALLKEVIAMLLGEHVLLAALHDSPAAGCLLEEMANTEGEALLVAKQGLTPKPFPQTIQRLVEEQRLLIVTPLPPKTSPNPAWETILERIAMAAAWRVVTGALTETARATATPTALLSSPVQSLPSHICAMNSIDEILVWFSDMPPVSELPPPDMLPATPALEPLPSPEVMLERLAAAGDVPEALRKRLLKKQ